MITVRLLTVATILTCAAVVAVTPARGQSQMHDPVTADLTIHADQPSGVIGRDLYGHFAEHLGRCIYEGMWVGPESKIPNTRGIRNDVVAALKQLNLPVLRWPGGCFADEYHWRDGIGPRERRPKRVNTHWGMVTETNAFGTHEFLDLCEQLGCEAYICGNVGSGTPQEMMEWVEYMTCDSPDSTLANERRKNGRDKPWRVKYFGVGNESWGCGGNMRPEYYADLYRRYATFVKNYPGNHILKIACGSNGEDFNWQDVVTERVGNRMDGISLHWYTLPTGSWKPSGKGVATGFPPKEWDTTIAHAVHIEDLIEKHLAIMEKHDPKKKIGLVIDEWGTWYDPTPGTNPGFLEQQNTIRDAVVAGINLNLFNAHCDRITMTNIAQTVNVLQAMILTSQEKMVLTPTYHVFEMYKVHQGATLLPSDGAAADYEAADGKKIPSVYVSASKAGDGTIHVSLVNARPDRPAKVTAKLAGVSAKNVSGRILMADKLDAHNTFEQPDAVKPASFESAKLDGGQLTLTLPAKSVVVLEVR